MGPQASHAATFFQASGLSRICTGIAGVSPPELPNIDSSIQVRQHPLEKTTHETQNIIMKSKLKHAPQQDTIIHQESVSLQGW